MTAKRGASHDEGGKSRTFRQNPWGNSPQLVVPVFCAARRPSINERGENVGVHEIVNSLVLAGVVSGFIIVSGRVFFLVMVKLGVWK